MGLVGLVLSHIDVADARKSGDSAFAQVVASVQSLQNSVGELSQNVESLKSAISTIETSFTKAVSDLRTDMQRSLAILSIVTAIVLPIIMFVLNRFLR